MSLLSSSTRTGVTLKDVLELADANATLRCIMSYIYTCLYTPSAACACVLCECNILVQMRAESKGVAGYYFHANPLFFSSVLLSERTIFVSKGLLDFSALDLAPLHRAFPHRRASSGKTSRRGCTRKSYTPRKRISSNRELTAGSMLAFCLS